jgi:hypothetical protein
VVNDETIAPIFRPEPMPVDVMEPELLLEELLGEMTELMACVRALRCSIYRQHSARLEASGVPTAAGKLFVKRARR